MADQHRLQSSVSEGAIHTDDLGDYEIEDGQIVVDDYETASALVDRISSVYWRNNQDPGHPDDDPIVSGEGDTGDFDVREWLDNRTVSKIKEDMEDIDDTDILRALRDESDRKTATEALGERLETLEGGEDESPSAESTSADRSDSETITTEHGSTGEADSASAHGIRDEAGNRAPDSSADAADSGSESSGEVASSNASADEIEKSGESDSDSDDEE